MPERSSSPVHLITIGVLVIALATVFLLGLQLNDDDAAPAAATTPTNQPRGIITSASATVEGTPDQLTFSGSVTNTRDNTQDAMAATTNGVRALTAAAKKAGVEAKDITSVGLSLRPKYSYADNQQRIVGYVATQRVRVLVRDLPSAGKVIAAVSSSAGNSVSVGGIQLEISNADELVAQARAEAVTKSKAAAAAIAEAAGRPVGKLEYVEEVAPQGTRYDRDYLGYDEAAFSSALSVKAVSISPGQQEVTVDVKVRWSLG